MELEFAKYSVDGGIATITLNRPQKRNAINVQTIRELQECWKRFAEGDARAAILNSSDPTLFSAGADLLDPPDQAWRAIPEIGFRTGKPIIAAVNGKAIGLAFILVAMCDLVVLSEDAELHYPEAKLGFSLSLVSTVAKRLPLKIAMELMLLGDPISGRRAYEVGFANRIVTSGQVLAEARVMARTLCANAPLVVRNLKRLSLDALGDTPVQAYYGVEQGTEAMMDSEDAAQGFEAFRNKTKPVFVGR
jgi:enoyl-CoA hydratase